MRRLLGVVLVLALAACAAPQHTAVYGSPMIDVPTPPFPYNSKFCT